MAKLVTADDVRQCVVESLTEYREDFYVEAIVSELVWRFDLTGDDPNESFEGIDHETYWEIVKKHEKPDRRGTSHGEVPGMGGN